MPDTPQRVPGVDRANLCGCGSCDLYFRVTICGCNILLVAGAFRILAAGLAAYSLRIEYCCPVSGPDWRIRDRLRSFAPSAMQASRCSSVSDWLYLLEAARNRARQRSCLKVRGLLGLM